MSEVVMRVGRVCPVCKRDGTNGQSVVQVHETEGNKVRCPECGTTWAIGAVHKDKPEPATVGKGKSGTKEEK